MISLSKFIYHNEASTIYIAMCFGIYKVFSHMRILQRLEFHFWLLPAGYKPGSAVGIPVVGQCTIPFLFIIIRVPGDMRNLNLGERIKWVYFFRYTCCIKCSVYFLIIGIGRWRRIWFAFCTHFWIPIMDFFSRFWNCQNEVAGYYSRHSDCRDV